MISSGDHPPRNLTMVILKEPGTPGKSIAAVFCRFPSIIKIPACYSMGI